MIGVAVEVEVGAAQLCEGSVDTALEAALLCIVTTDAIMGTAGGAVTDTAIIQVNRNMTISLMDREEFGVRP